jgi:hypothetical protein
LCVPNAADGTEYVEKQSKQRRIQMKFRGFLILAGTCGIVLARGNHVSAFMVNYKSLSGNDMAVIVGYKSTEITYDIKEIKGDGNDWDFERQVIFAGVSKIINSKLKLYGALNYVMDGEISIGDYSELGMEIESDGGYFLTGEVGYTFIDRSKFSVSGFGRIDYFFEDEWKIDVHTATQSCDSEGGCEEERKIGNSFFDVDGYEVVAGVMGKYNVTSNFSVFVTGKSVPFSDMTFTPEEFRESDIERKDMFGLQTGGVFDKDRWFVKGQYDFGMESGFGVSGGIKF